jgi:hypothetical protein
MLLASLPQIDLFVDDSIHTEYNTCPRAEDRAWSALRAGSVLVADDIDLNWGFRFFVQGIPDPFPVCCAEPQQYDPSRFAGDGLFGIAQKNVAIPRPPLVGSSFCEARNALKTKGRSRSKPA